MLVAMIIKSRTPSNESFLPYPYDYTKVGTGVSCVAGTIPSISWTPLVEEIRYGVGYGKTNVCTHFKTERSVMPTVVEVRGYPISDISQYCVWHLPAYYKWTNMFSTHLIGYSKPIESFDASGNYVATSSPIGQLDWRANSSRAIQSMWPTVEAGLSSLNSLYELKDLKRLPSLLSKHRVTLASFRKMLTSGAKLQKGKTKYTLKQMVQLASENHLNYSFGIGPLISDVKAVLAQLQSTRGRIRAILDLADKPLVSHCRIPLDILPAQDASVDIVHYITSGQDIYYRKIQRFSLESAWYTGTMRYSYKLDPIQRKLAYLLGTMDSFGVNLDISIIWNALPWSFVIDWVLGVSEWLEQFKRHALEPEVVIHEYNHSVRLEYRNSFYTQYGINAAYTTPEVLIGTERCVFYHREPSYPNYYSAIRQKGLNLYKFSLASALGITRVR